MSERIYCDPVHNIIRLRTDSGEGDLMMRLIDTPEFHCVASSNSGLDSPHIRARSIPGILIARLVSLGGSCA